MSNNSTNQSSEELDIGYLFKSFKNLINRSARALLLIILFFKKHWIITTVLIIVGVVYGYYKDSNTVTAYKSVAIVIPNFESTDYLYDKVNALNGKLQRNDSVYLTDVLGPNYKNLKRVDIEPIVDLYRFIADARENIDIFRIVSQSQDVTEYVEDVQNYKYYKYHRLSYVISGKDNAESLVKHTLEYFNDNALYSDYKLVGAENTQIQIQGHEKMINQIDSLIASAIKFENGESRNQSVFINDNSQLTSLLQTKERYLSNILKLKIKQKGEDKIIKDVDINYNLPQERGLYVPNKIKYPLLLLLIFSGFFFLQFLYKKLSEIDEGGEG